MLFKRALDSLSPIAAVKITSGMKLPALNAAAPSKVLNPWLWPHQLNRILIESNTGHSTVTVIILKEKGNQSTE